MKTKVLIPEDLVERVEWIEEKFPNFKITEAMLHYFKGAEYNTPIDGSEGVDDDASWIVIKDPQDLLDLKPIAHPHWIEDWDFEWPETLKHIGGGVTFAFMWREGFLAWEC